MNPNELSRFDELVSRYLDETLTKVDQTELVALLAEPPLAARFLEMSRLNCEIAGLLAAPVPDAAMVELVGADIKKDRVVARPQGGGLRIIERNEARPLFQTSTSAVPSQQRRRGIWQPLAWAAVFVIAAGLAAFFLVNRASSAYAASVVAVQGEVRLVGVNGQRALAAGQSWHHGEKIKTFGPNSSISMQLRDGTRIDFGGNTIAVNLSGKAGNRVELEYGEVRADVKKQAAGRKITLVTPEAEAVVVGTKFHLITGGNQTRIEVMEGEVLFRRRADGIEVAVKAGYFAIVAPNAPLTAKPIHPDHHVQ
jgi:ferric-dicitrate binding protein FerR (iron transport regulator)